MTKYQEEIYNTLKAWGGSNSVANTDNCGYNNAPTTTHNNAVKGFCNNYVYSY